MPTINIQGGGGGQPPGKPGMTASSGYTAAERQKMQQDRSQIQASRGKERDYRRMEQGQDAVSKAAQDAMSAEIKAFEARRKAAEDDLQRRNSRLQRIRQQDERYHRQQDTLRERSQRQERAYEVSDAQAMERQRRQKIRERDRQDRWMRAYEVTDAQKMDRQRSQRQREERSIEVANATAMDRNRTRRIGTEQRLRDRYDILQSKSRAVLTPANYRTMQRQTDILDRDVGRYASRYGGAPGWAGGIGSMRTGLGTESGAFAVQNVVRLGVSGQRAAENKEWTELARINQELKRIEGINQAQLNNSTRMSQEQKANAQRMQGAVAQARSRIGVARAGHSAATNAMGSMMGMAGIAEEYPVIAGAMAAGKLAYQAFMAPVTIASYAHAIANIAKPWDQFVVDTSRTGRGGNYNSEFLRQGLYGGYQGFAGGTPDWMKQLGVTSDNFNSISGAYGRSFGDPESAMQYVASVRRWNQSPFMDLSDERLSRSAGTATQLGVPLGNIRNGDPYATDTNGSRSNGWFATLQKVMAAATAQGLDHSTAINNVEGLLRSGASAGAMSLSGGSMGNFWNRMVSSDLPGMRSGEGVMATAGGINDAMGKIGVGGAPAQMFMMQSYFQKNGGMPKDEAGLQKLLGLDSDAWSDMNKTPTKRAMVKQYLMAAQAGQFPLAMTYLQPLMAGNYDAWQKIAEGSAFGGTNPLIKPLLMGQATGEGYTGYMAQTYGDRTLPGAPGQMPVIRDQNVQGALRSAAGSTGLPYAVVAGLAQTESSMNPNQTVSGSTASGLMGIIQGTRQEMGLSEADKFDPTRNAVAGSNYFKGIYSGMGDVQNPIDRLRMSYELYNWGPSQEHAAKVRAGQEPADIRRNANRFMQNVSSFANTPDQQNATIAQLNQMDLTAGRQIRENALNPANNMGVTDSAVAFSAAIVNGTNAVAQFTQALMQAAAMMMHRPAIRGGISPGSVPMQP